MSAKYLIERDHFFLVEIDNSLDPEKLKNYLNTAKIYNLNTVIIYNWKIIDNLSGQDLYNYDNGLLNIKFLSQFLHAGPFLHYNNIFLIDKVFYKQLQTYFSKKPSDYISMDSYVQKILSTSYEELLKEALLKTTIL